MAILSKGTDFSTGDQVTAANLDALVDNATFASGAVDNTSTALDASSPQKIIVKDLGITTSKLANSSSTTTGVTFAKIQHVAANTVLVNDTNAEGDISAKAVADTQILIGDGNGFTAAALSGDATMTNAGVVDISDDVALGGNPTTTTQSAGNNTTRVATTAFVTTAVANVNVTPNNRLLIKVLPADFSDTLEGHVEVSSGTFKYANFDIPSGYKATEIVAYGNCKVEILEGNIANQTVTSKSSLTEIGSGTTINFTDITSSATNYLIVKITKGSSSPDTDFNGGSITLVAV